MNVSEGAMIRVIWSKWLRFTDLFGTIQMILILSIVYWTIIAIMAIPFKFFADPLSTKGPSRAGWTRKCKGSSVLQSMKNQY